LFDSLFTDPQGAHVRRIGYYSAGRFVIDPRCTRRRGVYFFVRHRPAGPLTVLRVGIAFGMGGLGGRFALHNRWLAGLFKPHDAAEQQARALMLKGLGDGVEVWAWLLDNKQLGLQIERLVREHLGAALRLDRAAKGSWMNLSMAAWRAKRAR
jgi:hypothetical protein